MIRHALAVLAVVLLAGCAETRKPIDPDMIGEYDEIPPGPGLLTGKEGAIIWRR